MKKNMEDEQKRDKPISKTVISRLPRYYRFLGMIEAEGVSKTSSSDLARRMGLTASQIRQDLNCFGGFGQQGYGYNVSELKKDIGDILGINNNYSCVLFGAGNIGMAISQHLNFSALGFKLTAIFDINKNLIGKKIYGVEIHDVSEYESLKEKLNPKAAILCTPDEVGFETTKLLYDSGVRYFWNFSHYNINKDFEDAIVENVHLNDSLMTLCYAITNDDKID
jgi:redox-sensing transcriptional repressor